VTTLRRALCLLTGHVAIVLSAGAATGCQGVLDAGHDLGRAPLLPVGPENPVILLNDGPRDNWQGEYASLLSQRGGPPLAGIVISTGGMWMDLDSNVAGWQGLVTAAKASGLDRVPDPIRSASQPLQRPTDGNVDSTTPNDSEGARFIVETALRLATVERPLVVATGGRLTDIADAYLLDRTVADRVVVVASLGTGFAEGEAIARMGVPNGEMDTWADSVVAEKFRYVQVSAYYEQAADLPVDRLDELPENALGDWMRAKQPDIFGTPLAADQVSVLALGVSTFARSAVRLSPSGWEGDIVTLAPDDGGRVWLVTESDGPAATARVWDLLRDPATFSN
jgi:hypothetical protein